MLDEKRLKKEYKAVRGCYTIRVPDDVSFDTAHDVLTHALEPFSPEDHHIHDMWRKR